MNNNNTNSGVGFLGLLSLVFITLKLLGVIKWSWLWVLAPIWIPAAIIIPTIIIIIVIGIMRELRKVKK